MKTNLKQYRKAMRLTQAELAELVGATNRQIGTWERGEAEMDLVFACRLANVFDCSLDEFVGNPVRGERSYDAEQALLLSYFSLLNDEGRQRLLEYAQMMVKSGMFVKSEDNQVPRSA